jgi:hypothetical protein
MLLCHYEFSRVKNGLHSAIWLDISQLAVTVDDSCYDLVSK